MFAVLSKDNASLPRYLALLMLLKPFVYHQAVSD